MKSKITICPKCKTQIIPKSDGTCPNCQHNISHINSSKPIRQSNNYIKTTEPSPSALKRGGCLTTILIGMLILNPLTAIYFFIIAGSSTNHSLSNTPAWIIPYLITGCVANFIFSIAIWKWKKWGLYGLAGVSVIGFIINAIYIGILYSLLGFANAATLAFLLRQTWRQME